MANGTTEKYSHDQLAISHEQLASLQACNNRILPGNFKAELIRV